jgi:hypothetical protein
LPGPDDLPMAKELRRDLRFALDSTPPSAVRATVKSQSISSGCMAWTNKMCPRDGYGGATLLDARLRIQELTRGLIVMTMCAVQYHVWHSLGMALTMLSVGTHVLCMA